MRDKAMDSTITIPLSASEAQIEAEARARQKSYWLRVYFWRSAILVALLGSWELAARQGWIDPFHYSMPSAIWARLIEWTTEGTSEGPLWYHLWVTMEESILGFLTGSVIGVIAGIALGRNQMASDVFALYIKLINSIPRVVLAPIFTVILGLGLASKVALSFIMVFFVVFSNAFQGVREADKAMIANARILGASNWQLTRFVIIPSAMSWIFASLHVSFGFAIIGAIVGEFVGARYGIGLLISVAKGSFDSAGMFAAILIVMAVALLAEYLMTYVEGRFASWKPQTSADAA
ncbi:MAG: ABC transporter permease [Alphaproteobacteria bacterium]|nr:ABC transporter permease [Alphaproteobacteria bacterium]